MLIHVLGWLTVAAQLGVTGYVVRVLTVTGRESRTWLRRLPTPRYAAVPPSDYNPNYVGLV